MEFYMKKSLLALVAIASVATFAIAETEAQKEIKEDIVKHRTIAAAHERAAKCLESGKGHDACMKILQESCTGITYGKFCGMKHEH
jgi:hypothetical protein